MLLRNFNKKKDLCNGTRLIVEEAERNLIKAKTISAYNRNYIVLISRTDFAPTETTLLFTLKHRYVPIVPAYYNKQGSRTVVLPRWHQFGNSSIFTRPIVCGFVTIKSCKLSKGVY